MWFFYISLLCPKRKQSASKAKTRSFYQLCFVWFYCTRKYFNWTPKETLWYRMLGGILVLSPMYKLRRKVLPISSLPKHIEKNIYLVININDAFNRENTGKLMKRGKCSNHHGPATVLLSRHLTDLQNHLPFFNGAHCPREDIPATEIINQKVISAAFTFSLKRDFLGNPVRFTLVFTIKTVKHRQNPFLKLTKIRNMIIKRGNMMINSTIADREHLPNSITCTLGQKAQKSSVTPLGSKSYSGAAQFSPQIQWSQDLRWPARCLQRARSEKLVRTTAGFPSLLPSRAAKQGPGRSDHLGQLHNPSQVGDGATSATNHLHLLQWSHKTRDTNQCPTRWQIDGPLGKTERLRFLGMVNMDIRSPLGDKTLIKMVKYSTGLRCEAGKPLLGFLSLQPAIYQYIENSPRRSISPFIQTPGTTTNMK